MPSARVRAFAKLNLTLEVLNRRNDGFHELRTVFQTISLADVLEVEVRRGRAAEVSLQCDVPIEGENLAVRAANAVLNELEVRAAVEIRLRKNIPMGAGLGGGSSDAAAVLRLLPELIGRRLPRPRLIEIGASLGSDVPFFLLGGTALGLGRGTELYPLSDLPRMPVLVVAPPIHVSTAGAYRALHRGQGAPPGPNRTAEVAWAMSAGGDWPTLLVNDFEQAVFTMHAELARIRKKLHASGARAARMTGSGSALFGVYDSAAERDAAASRFPGSRVIKAAFTRRLRAGPTP